MTVGRGIINRKFCELIQREGEGCQPLIPLGLVLVGSVGGVGVVGGVGIIGRFSVFEKQTWSGCWRVGLQSPMSHSASSLFHNGSHIQVHTQIHKALLSPQATAHRLEPPAYEPLSRSSTALLTNILFIIFRGRNKRKGGAARPPAHTGFRLSLSSSS